MEHNKTAMVAAAVEGFEEMVVAEVARQMARPTWNRTMPSHPHRTLMRHVAAEDVDAVVAAEITEGGEAREAVAGAGLQPQPMPRLLEELRPKHASTSTASPSSRLCHSSGRRQLSLAPDLSAADD